MDSINTAVTVFGDFIILMNASVVHDIHWIKELKAIDPKYVPSTKWKQNKTLIFKYRSDESHVFGLDIFMKDAVIIIHDHTELINSYLLQQLIDYLIFTIKNLCPVTVANEVGFRLTIYTPITHPNNFVFEACSYFKKFATTLLGNVLGNAMRGYEVNFNFDKEWNLIPLQNPSPDSRVFKTSTHQQITPKTLFLPQHFKR